MLGRRQLGWSGLCIFIRPLMEGADGFLLMYFHLLLTRVNFLQTIATEATYYSALYIRL